MTGADTKTIMKLLGEVGQACSDYQDKAFKGLECKRIQCDEIWSFCYAKDKNVPKDKRDKFGYGDVWTWTSICEDSKLVPSWYIGKRNPASAKAFMNDLAGRMKHRIQLTTDGLRIYLDAVEEAFRGNIDYSQLIKIYGFESETQKRYSPERCIGAKKEVVNGKPDINRASTSFVERQNLTMRMSMRRFTRLTNAFSKKIENLVHAVSLHFMYYNFVRIPPCVRIDAAFNKKTGGGEEATNVKVHRGIQSRDSKADNAANE